MRIPVKHIEEVESLNEKYNLNSQHEADKLQEKIDEK